MDQIFENMRKVIRHLEILHKTFNDVNEQHPEVPLSLDLELYRNNLENFQHIITDGGFVSELYAQKGRQMILADFFEYVFLGRMYVALRTRADKENFFRVILHFVNMLMCYEAITVNDELRERFLTDLGEGLPDVAGEEHFEELKNFEGKVGLTEAESDADARLNDYFDKLLPKTAGGLWHELLVYIFMIRSDFGYIVPLLNTQRLIGRDDHIVPPDFLIITKDRHIYGVEVGMKKEIQSGSFSIRTSIPTATIDTINSRSSDRCPICHKWILFCPFVINNFSNFEYEIARSEVRCCESCTLFNREQVAAGECSYTKYRRNRTQAEHTHHAYSNNYHYHYQCVLNAVGKDKKQQIIEAQDSTALKTHYPYYAGLEYLTQR
jgi:hypothetical protein